MGALGDSFYEYLLKAWVMNRTDEQALQIYENTMAVCFYYLPHSAYVYINEYRRLMFKFKSENVINYYYYYSYFSN